VSNGLVDTYTIRYTDNTTSTFTVTNCSTDAEKNVQADWSQTVITEDDYIKNKPTVVSAFTNDAGYLTSESDPNVPAWAKTATKPTYSYSEITGTPTLNTTNITTLTTSESESLSGTINLHKVSKTGDYNDLLNTPTIPTVPANVSAFTNDAGYITSTSLPTVNNNKVTITVNGNTTSPAGSFNLNQGTDASINIAETDPTVPAWAKAAAKPTYNYSEIQDKPTIPTVPANVSAFTNDAGYITAASIPTVNNATLTIQKNGTSVGTFTANQGSNETINIEVPDAQVQANWTETNTSSKAYIKNKPTDLVHDASYVHTDTNYTTAEKSKLAGIAAGAEVNVQSDWNQNDNTKDDYIKNKPTIPTVNDKTVTITVNGSTTPAGTFNLNQGTDASINIAETDPTVPAWAKATTKPTYSYSEIQNTPNLATVATTGSYNDLLNTPPIPAAPGTLITNNTQAQTASASEDLSGTINLHKVSKTGSYNDLNDKPSIPTVYNNTVTIQANGTSVGSFNLNQNSDKTINITIPAAPGTLNTNNTGAQTANSSEDLSGTINLHKVSKTGDYNDLLNTPPIPSAPGTLITNNTQAQTASASEALSGTINLHKVSKTGSYNDLNDKPTIPAAQVRADWNETSTLSKAYILNKPTIPTVNDATVTITVNGNTTSPAGSFNLNQGTDANINIAETDPTVPAWAKATTKPTYNYSEIQDKPTIPTVPANVSAFTNDAGYITAASIPTVNNATLTIQKNGTSVGTFTANQGSNETINIEVPDAQVQANWTETNTSSKAYIKNKPTDLVHDASYVHTDANYTTAEKSKLAGIAAGAEVNVQSDWNQDDNTQDDYIKNKPTIPTVNDKTVTITVNGSTTPAGTFNLNQGTDASINIAETDPTVPAWAKAAAKPTYNYSDIVGAPTVNNNTLTINQGGSTLGTFTANASTGTTINVTAPGTLITNNTQAQTASASEALSGTINLHKVSKTGNYNDLLNTPTIPTVPANVSAFTNDAGYITSTALPTVNNNKVTITVNGNTTSPAGTFNLNQGTDASINIAETDPTVPAWAKAAAKPTYNYSDIVGAPTVNNATLTINQGGSTLGTFTANASTGTTINVTAPGTLKTNNTTTQEASASESLSGTINLHKVSKTGSYNDLLNKPTIPTVNNATLTIQKNGTNVQTFTANQSTAATANIVVNNATLTIQKNGSTVQTFSADQSTNATANITVPTKTSELTNDAGYITQAAFEQYVAALSQAYQDKIDSLGNIVEDVGSQYSVKPKVFTVNVNEVGSNSATVFGRVFFDGGSPILQKGFLYGTNPDSTTFTSLVDENSIFENADGTFGGVMLGLSNGTTYYVCAYARNIKGISYGTTVLNFTTAASESISLHACPDASTVEDADGNIYNTVLIGDQCWTRENMRTTHTCAGVEIPLGTSTNANVGYRYYPNNNPNLVRKYGYLYNWVAATQDETGTGSPSGVQGICPNNWHVPSDEEWITLQTYINNNFSSGAGQALADKTGWAGGSNVAGSPGNNVNLNNETGFSALPAGFYDGTYDYYSTYCCFWNASKTASRMIYNNATLTTSASYGALHGFSIRCVKNIDEIDPAILANRPKDTTISVSSVGTNTATINASVTAQGGAAVTARGICWSATQVTPTIAGHKVSSGTGTGDFTANITGLEPGKVYYVRAYATNSYGTTYGNVLSITTFENATAAGQVCPGTNNVKDYDGNVYNTVQIGNQCWTRENMRTTHYANGGVIKFQASAGGSYGEAFRYAPNNKQYNIPVYGYLYNWYAAMQGGDNVQGLCPDGWHVPSETEWNTLINYVKANSNCQCGNNSEYVAKSLSSTKGWNSNGTTCVPGNVNTNESYNNKSGFSALPAGYQQWRSDDGFALGWFGQYAWYWSSTSATNNDNRYGRFAFKVVYNSAVMQQAGNVWKYSAFSVRCLKN